LQRSWGLQNEVEVGTRRALSAVILVTWTATPWEREEEREREKRTARERCSSKNSAARADVNELRSCYIPVCHHRDFLPFSLPSSPNILVRSREREIHVELRSSRCANLLESYSAVRHNFIVSTRSWIKCISGSRDCVSM